MSDLLRVNKFCPSRGRADAPNCHFSQLSRHFVQNWQQ